MLSRLKKSKTFNYSVFIKKVNVQSTHWRLTSYVENRKNILLPLRRTVYLA